MSEGVGPAQESNLFDESADPDHRFLLPIDGNQARRLVPIVCDIVTDAGGDLLLASPVTLPEQTPLSSPQPKREAEHQLAKFVLTFNRECDELSEINQVLKIGRNRSHILKDIVESHHIDTVITDDQPRTGIRSLLGLEAVEDETVPGDCNTVIVTRTNYPDEFDSVLVPIARGPHSGLAIDIGLALARQNEASLELLHVHKQGDDEAEQRGQEVLESGRDRVGNFKMVETTLWSEEDAPAAVVSAARQSDVVVLGAPREGLIQQYVLDTIPDSVSKSADGTVMIAHSGRADGSWFDRWI